MVKKPIPLQHAIHLCNTNEYSTYSFSRKGFIGFVKLSGDQDVNSPSFMKDLINEINETLVNDITAEILREDRELMRWEQRRSWSTRRTRAPFYYRARKQAQGCSFMKSLVLAEQVVNHMGSPWRRKKRGRPPLYSSKKLASVLLVKHYHDLSFEALHARIVDMRYDCLENTEKKKAWTAPSTSSLHVTMKKIPIKYFEECMRLLDDWTAQMHEELFGARELHEFGVDATEITCNELKERLVGLKRMLWTETFKVNALVRLVTNTICEVSSSKKENLRDLRNLLKKRKASGRSIQNMEVLADAAYDAEYNYEYCVENGVDPVIKPTKYSKKKAKGFYRKKMIREFSKQRYKMRKTCERPFGNTTMRDSNKIYYKLPNMKQKVQVLRFIAHNMKAYFMQEAWSEIFLKL